MLSIYFMFDNHTFAKVADEDRASLIRQATRLFAEDGCGSLYVRDEFGGTLRALTLDGKRLKSGAYGVTPDEIEQWADAVLVESSFRHRMCA